MESKEIMPVELPARVLNRSFAMGLFRNNKHVEKEMPNSKSYRIHVL